MVEVTATLEEDFQGTSHGPLEADFERVVANCYQPRTSCKPRYYHTEPKPVTEEKGRHGMKYNEGDLDRTKRSESQNRKPGVREGSNEALHKSFQPGRQCTSGLVHGILYPSWCEARLADMGWQSKEFTPLSGGFLGAAHPKHG
jgi:hypothetical protein